MSVQNQIVKNVYEGNGSTTVFPYTFALNETDGEHVKVYIADESELSTPTDNFTIDTQLRTVTYPKTGAALPEGSKIVIRREIPNEQDTNLENNGAFFAETIEREFDREVMMIQQLVEQVDRSVKTDMSSVTTPDELIAELRAKAQAAVDSASAALVSENNAKASEQAAAQSETNAESYKDTTYGYMTTAETLATQAGQSATTATNKAAEASESASAAAQSKTAAEAAADTAYDYMIEAGASESIATQKATEAANSATSASTSATSAAASAELASTFAHRLPVGTIYAYAGNGENPIGALLCDGSAVSRTMYPDLFEKIGTTYGAGDGSTTFNLPNLSDNRFVEGSTTAGTAKSAGLPNITGKVGRVLPTELPISFSGAFSAGERLNGLQPAPSQELYFVNFDASRSSAIYGNSDTVQPKSLTLRYFIQAFDGQTPDSALIDITQYAQELATKANRDLSNLTQTGQDSFLERDFTIIYPNGGSESSPANIAINNIYLEANPFPNYHIAAILQIFYNNKWFETGWVYFSSANATYGTRVEEYNGQIRIVTGTGSLTRGSSTNGTDDDLGSSSAPCRVKVWKIGKVANS